jgi:cytochrome c-type biogenesis protein CcmF
MEAEIGTYCLVLGLAVAFVTAAAGLWGAARRDVNLIALAASGTILMAVLIIGAFTCLTVAFISSDFSVLTVASNSNTEMPLLFRITGTWGNHEGSLLLWVLVLTLFGAAIVFGGGRLPQTLMARVLAIQALLAAAFLSLIVFTSSPFERLTPAPLQGQELNPLLQDIGLAIHPPFLYLGYVGFSVTFAFAVAALIEGRIDASWARFVRPWILAAWVFLTIGIALGSFWAYYELGWGGWWFWDPVENASFMPWLVGSALLHSALVVERRGALVVWTILLAILTFSLSLIGTFLVRSGVLTSVHSFASDPARGIGVLLILFLFTGGALTLFAARAQSFDRPVLFAPVSREGGLVLNNILLITAAGTVFLGTFYPLFFELLTADKISVGPPFFNRTFVPIMIPLMLALVIGANLRWKRDRLREAARRGIWAILPVVAIASLLVFLGGAGHFAGVLGVALGLWVVVGSVGHFVARVQLLQGSLSRSWRLLTNTPRAFFGMFLAHLGLGLAVIGISAVSSWSEENIVALPPGEIAHIGVFDVRLDRVKTIAGPNYQSEQGIFIVTRDGRDVVRMSSERRFFTSSGRMTTEAAIQPRGLSNLYIALGDPDQSGRWVARMYWHPFVLLIWIGPLVMGLGGLVSLSDRRFRVGAPSRSPRTAAIAEGV